MILSILKIDPYLKKIDIFLSIILKNHFYKKNYDKNPKFSLFSQLINIFYNCNKVLDDSL